MGTFVLQQNERHKAFNTLCLIVAPLNDNERCRPTTFFAESEGFERAKNLYAQKAEHLQHLIDQQRARLDQIAAEQQRIKKEVRSTGSCSTEIMHEPFRKECPLNARWCVV